MSIQVDYDFILPYSSLAKGASQIEFTRCTEVMEYYFYNLFTEIPTALYDRVHFKSPPVESIHVNP